ncbi:MAG: biotin--[acetyl-CoA-carboxylase] ligase, partial [Planctomycetota bacterium]|nr:biotin--[acetyl-CoA-carboxylase] ligase [Planctomycetota bacterium]
MRLQDLARASGWRVEHRPETGSTNDVAGDILAAGASARTVVVADRQTRGRGREGRAYESPPGGLYVSLLVDAAPADRPGLVVALVACAAADAIEAVSGLAVGIKWPNEL